MNLPLEIVKNYLLTVLLEIMVLMIFREKRIKVYIASIIINLITNVPLNLFLLTYYFSNDWHYIITLISLELLIIVIEVLLYYLLIKDKKRSIIYGVFCNLYSFLIGLIIAILVKLIFQ